MDTDSPTMACKHIHDRSSNAYHTFCVASEGYRDFFIRRGVSAKKIAVSGIPNSDNCARFLKNNFPFTGFVLVCTSDARETLKRDDRNAFILNALSLESFSRRDWSVVCCEGVRRLFIRQSII